ncbi:TAXI family TRAP transporter solute-binding subunit [soil metagenome]
MHTPLRALSFLVAASLAALACQAPRASGPEPVATGAEPSFEGRSVNIVTGPPGGVYVVYGAGIANVLTQRLKVSASPQSTPASVDNMKLMRDGKADLALVLSDTAFEANAGKGRFAPPEAKADVKALAVMYTNYTHVVAKDGAGINTIGDLKGKRVSVGAAGSGTETIANRVLEAAGLSAETDIRRERMNPQDSSDALRDGKIDAFFWSGGLPTSSVFDLANATRVKLIEHTAETKKMAEKYGPYYFETKVPKGTYKNESDVAVSGVANLLVAPSSFDAKLTQAILRTLFDYQPDLVTVHAEAKNLKLETAVEGSPIDYHQGAIDFYRSKGAWKK